MNQLQRIILINSGNIEYREIELDGDIHFIGTQGTGKSTLLRAILFFYNADTRKLGISNEKKPFSDFYFPHADSYIFYEVQNDMHDYCVWLYRRQNRLCFRFVDGPYSKEMVIDDNRARPDYEVIEEAEKRGFKVERPIYSFSEYRDIIYGANTALKRYNLLNNKSYQNIPRTLSNIFLNSSLDGGFIKKTIIRSFSDEVFEINLDVNRHHLEKARGDYASVYDYLKHEKKAQYIVDVYEEILKQEFKQKELAKQIGGAYNHAKEQERVTRDSLSGTLNKIEEQKSIIKSLDAAHQEKHAELKGKLFAVNRDIKKAKSLQREYDEKNIQELLSEYGKKAIYEQEKLQKEEQYRLLTTNMQELEQQYKHTIQNLKNKTEEQVNALEKEKSLEREKIFEAQSKSKDELYEEIEALSNDFQNKKSDHLEEQKKKEGKLQELRFEIKTLQGKEYFGEERKALAQKERELQTSRINLEAEEKQFANQNESLQKENESEKKFLELETQQQLQKLTSERDQINDQAEKLISEISLLEGSLLEFLETNKPEWNSCIGKVIDRKLLLRNDLEPEIQEGDHLFGLKLKLEDVDSIKLSKKDLENELTATREKLKEKNEQLGKYREEIQLRKDKLQKKTVRGIAEIADQLKQCRYQLQQTVIAIEKNRMAANRLKEQAENSKREEIQKLENEKQKTENELREVLDTLKKIHEQDEKAIAELKNQFDSKLKSQKQQLEDLDNRVLEQINQLRTNLQIQFNDLEEQRNFKLKEQGVDTNKLKQLEQEISVTQQKLNHIQLNYKTIVEYEKDCNEYINRLDNFTRDQKAIKEDIAHEQLITNKQIDLEKEILRKHTKESGQINKTLDDYVSQIKHYERFKKERLFDELKSHIEHQDKYTETSCTDLIEILKNLVLEYEKNDKSLTERITEFSGYFSEKNCLGFATIINGVNQYRAFAENLKEFVKEHKIIEFKTEVTRKYAMVLENIVNETNDLLHKESDIQEIIDRINADFKRSNFVGVVKSIEMRLQKSGNKVIQILRQIRTMQQENAMNYGDLNLFNQDGSGKKDKEAVALLESLQNQIEVHKNNRLQLEDAFELEFRIKENDNDTGWTERLSNVGSNGTDVLVKSMIYINLLNIFKSNGSKRQADTVLHCLIDEVGILHDSNITGLISFARERNICLINGSPNSHNEQDYKHIYMFRRNKVTNKTGITKLITNVEVE